MKAPLSISEKVLLFGVEHLGALLIRLLGASWRVRLINRDLEQNLKSQHSAVILAFWHSQMLIPTYTQRQRDTRIMISQSKDGEYIARTVQRLGFTPVRGSTSRRGAQALAEMVRQGRAGYDLGITPDGPRGPRYQARIGAAILARDSGLPVIPCGVTAKKRIELNTWDRFAIPYPFTTAVVRYNPPIYVSPDADRKELEKKRLEIEKALILAQQQAEKDVTR
ncbi:MAG: hypothetical protein B6244_12295 [Candidatus Cloacimonetes bacterium 4572_55]|nr:MAG: hypothetical protein B6244_12295 [Candidatus Cloacimonetes bacterium 4572_55]